MDNLELILTEELQQEFLEYLKEDPEFECLESLNEEVLTEGKLLNKIRWKLALFSLRFLKESSINDFLRAYYSDKDGKETEKSKEWVAKKKKEKLAKMRELANEKMNQEEKDKIANSEVAKKLEKSALISGVVAGVAGVSAGVAANASKTIRSGMDNVRDAQTTNDIGFVTDNQGGNTTYRYDSPNGNIQVDGSKELLKDIADKGEYIVDRGPTAGGTTIYTIPITRELNKWNKIDNSLSIISSVFATLSSLIFGAMWGSIILAGVSAARGLRQAHKANVVRRDEIIGELLKNKDTRDLKECLEFLNGDIDSQKTLIEMYQSGDFEFYNAINNLHQQKVLKEDFSKYKK